MPVPCVPPPSCFFSLGQEANRLFYLQLQDVEAVRRVPNLHEESSSIVIDLEQPTLDGNVADDLIELTQVHKVSLEPRDEVDVGQLAMLASLADEQDGVAPFDLNDAVVVELHRLTNL